MARPTIRAARNRIRVIDGSFVDVLGSLATLAVAVAAGRAVAVAAGAAVAVGVAQAVIVKFTMLLVLTPAAVWV
jgi:hypothetical protein